VWQRIRSADGLLDEKYDGGALDRALERFLSDKRLAETKPDLLVPAYNMGDPGPYFFKSRKAREEKEDFPLSQVARATAAAPTYFEPAEVAGQALVDGGVFAANPAMCAFAEVMRFEPAADIFLLSLGTGQRTHKRSFDEVEDWGLVEWAKPILDVVFDGVSDAVDYQLRHALDDGHYWRLQVELDRAADALDNAGEENLRLLREQAEQLISDRSADIDAAIAAFT
jgi:patatin-like phospholipase/acyl hydrolase